MKNPRTTTRVITGIWPSAADKNNNKIEENGGKDNF